MLRLIRAALCALALAALTLLGAGAAAAQQKKVPEIPDCNETCDKMKASGDLREDFSLAGCRVKVCHTQARTFYEAFEFQAALASLDQIHEMASFQIAYQLDRGLILYAMGRFDEALAGFDRVVQSRPQSVRGAAQRAHTLLRLGRLPEARAQFEKILGFPGADREYKKLKTRSYVRGNLGLLRLMEEDLAGGRKELRKAREIDPRNELAHTYLETVVPALENGTLAYAQVANLVAAFEELSLRRANAGLRELSTVLNKSPNFLMPYLLAAETQRRYMDFKGCELTLRMAEQRFPDDTQVFANRIRCTMLRYGIQSPESMASIEELKRLAQKDPDDPLVKEILLLISQ